MIVKKYKSNVVDTIKTLIMGIIRQVLTSYEKHCLKYAAKATPSCRIFKGKETTGKSINNLEAVYFRL